MRPQPGRRHRHGHGDRGELERGRKGFEHHRQRRARLGHRLPEVEPAEAFEKAAELLDQRIVESCFSADSAGARSEASSGRYRLVGSLSV
jgi:hypothetical protein